ncbi:MAG: hypothetical protein M1831_004818 [Alyxoria varia]|nr:MAG: hypothetical protein M1831_004818 [Alyxoria varia]
MAFPEPFVVAPKAAHTHTIILLHGRDGNGPDFAEELFDGKTTDDKPSLESIPAAANTKWVFPSAHERMSSVFQEELQEWFDIYSLSDPDSERERQVEGLKESVEHIRSIIDEEMESLPASKIIIGGISQGFAVASHVLLSCPHRLGGFIGLSGWIPFQTDLRQVLNSEISLSEFYSTRLGTGPATMTTTQTPVYVSHNIDDNTVEIEHGRAAGETLRNFGMRVTQHEYDDGDHWIQEPKGYSDLAGFLTNLLKE